jgi:PTS system mannose-specific IID component
MKGQSRALLRLLAVQGAWSYERMIGVGMGYAAEPLLHDLGAVEPARLPEATARSSEFFNCHPYLAGLALGATARAEYEGTPGEQILRLRTALCSPLGALGDQFFWAGLVPILIAMALACIALGGGGAVLVALVVVYNVIRVLATHWALRTGLQSGMQVGTAISASWLPKAVVRVAVPAGFATGLAVPLVSGWLIDPFGGRAFAIGLLVCVAALALLRWGGTRWTSLRVGLLAAALSLFLTRVVP